MHRVVITDIWCCSIVYLETFFYCDVISTITAAVHVSYYIWDRRGGKYTFIYTYILTIIQNNHSNIYNIIESTSVFSDIYTDIYRTYRYVLVHNTRMYGGGASLGCCSIPGQPFQVKFSGKVSY